MKKDRFPLSPDQFEAILESFCQRHSQTLTNDLRLAFVSFIHQTPRRTFFYKQSRLDQWLLKSIANQMSFEISQKILKAPTEASADVTPETKVSEGNEAAAELQ